MTQSNRLTGCVLLLETSFLSFFHCKHFVHLADYLHNYDWRTGRATLPHTNGCAVVLTIFLACSSHATLLFTGSPHVSGTMLGFSDKHAATGLLIVNSFFKSKWRQVPGKMRWFFFKF